MGASCIEGMTFLLPELLRMTVVLNCDVSSHSLVRAPLSTSLPEVAVLSLFFCTCFCECMHKRGELKLLVLSAKVFLLFSQSIGLIIMGEFDSPLGRTDRKILRDLNVLYCL